MTEPVRHERTLLTRILGHAAMRCIEAFVLAWIVWFAGDLTLTAGEHDHSMWAYMVQNGILEFWEHLFLVRDSAVRGGAWWLLLGCLCITCFMRYRVKLRSLLEG
ncbi:MAG: hypothetical protein CMJ36_04180 [Phycisphaerae bacterium]|nr:hypothetical protein [Phycisphaerae bacterium]